ncbi:hypothetical protein G9A89_013180 [Geosiphon pyriformis]|nr:hypothetical protein G9A89_013180 [Geosiphon pyriformis]
MKKTIKVSGFESGFKAVVLRKKRKESVLAEDIGNRKVAVEAPSARSWSSETGDTTEFESIDMKKECLVAFVEGDSNQTPKSLRVKTKKVLGKPLSVIDYDTVNTDNDVLDDFSFLLPPLPIKLTIQVPVCKSFALDIDLMAIARKSSQEKLSFIRKFFSSVNGFGGASTPLKFGGIIHATFTLEKARIAAGKLANDCGVVVNTNLKHPLNNRMNWAIVMKEIPVGTSMEAVRTAVSEFGLIKSIKIQLVGLWQKAISIFIGKDAICVARADVDKQTWDSRDEFRALLYTLSSESDLVSAMAATPVIKRIGLCWSHLSLALCSVCGLSGHTSLNCVLVKVGSTLRGRKTPLSAQDQVKLVTIYAWKSAPISHPLAFSGKTWASVVGAPLVHNFHGTGSLLGSDNVGKPLLSAADDLEKRLVYIESSLVSLAEQIGELAKRLESFMLAVSQPSSGWEDIVMGVDLGDATSDKTAAILGSTVSPEVVKLENMLEGLSASVMILLACLDGLALAGGALPLPLS